jgi:hypothetical protein
MAQLQVHAKITANSAVVATTPLRSVTSNGGKVAMKRMVRGRRKSARFVHDEMSEWLNDLESNSATIEELDDAFSPSTQSTRLTPRNKRGYGKL